MKIDTEIIQKAWNELDREDTADYMAELLMDDDNGTYKMFEELASACLNGSEEFRKGLNDAVIILTGWSLDTIAREMLQKYAPATDGGAA